MANSVKIQDAALQKAAGEGMDAFIKVFTDEYLKVIGGEVTAETMPLLNGYQHSLLGYQLLRNEVMDGGFVQLIHNGYGPYIFDNPFAKAMRLMGAKEFSKLVYKAKKMYDEHKEELVADCTDEEFMALFERFECFDDCDDEFIEMEEEVTETLAVYVDEHLDDFAEIVK